jgi:hypothetical protein
MKINLMKDEISFYSQRNNELEPNSSCNVTAMVQALAILDVPLLQSGKYNQPEDELRALIVSFGGEPTVHADLSKGVNIWLGTTKTRFTMQASPADIIADIQAGKPSVMSGAFPYKYRDGSVKQIGHIVTISGVELSEEDGSPKLWYVQDPYGNTWNNWQGSGRNIVFSHGQFIAYFKTLRDAGKKWRHYFL